MANTGANADQSKTLEKGDRGVPDATASQKSTSDGNDAGRRSSRGPGKEV